MPESSPASLLYAGRRLPIDRELTIGRADDNDVVVSHERVSRHHARIYREHGAVWIADMGSRHGTVLNGRRFSDEPQPLEPGDAVTVGEETLRLLAGQETRMASRELPVIGTQVVDFVGERMSIGRDESNDVVLPDPNVSRFHSEVVRRDDEVEVVDLGSRNGTRVNGQQVERAVLRPGSDVGIGPYRLIFDGSTFVARDDHGALWLEARNVAVRAKDAEILAPTSLTLEPGELVALIGESGAGKTTLLKVLAGVNHPSEGEVSVNGEPVANRLTDIGYVPQDEIVHGLLTVHEALRYAARLRLPQDASLEEIDAAVERVLGELSLEERAETQIGALSGGQRKRTGVATELLNRPSLLFLDEPTTGLDPGLETQAMERLHALSRRGRAVAVVTHATKNLGLCDKVVVMGRGGLLTFHGPPEEALGFFGVDTYDGIYTALDETPASVWRERFEQRLGGDEEAVQTPPSAGGRTEPRHEHALPQLGVLVRRYAKLMLRDRRNLALLLGQAPILALFNVALFSSGVFKGPGGTGDAAQLLFLLSITVIWLGSIDAAPEIVKEHGVVERESAVGVRLSAYLASKVIVLFALVAVQVLLYAGVNFIFRPLHAPVHEYLGIFALLVATGFTAVGMGMLVSAAVHTQDQAMSLIPLAVIPQLLFAGTVVTLERMAGPAHAIANVIFSQWSLASLGTEIGMNGRMAADPEFAQVNRFGTHFFDVPLATGLLVQAAFLAVFLVAVAAVLHRRLRA